MLLVHPEPIDHHDPEEDEEDTGWGRWFQEEVLAPERTCRDRMDARRPFTTLEAHSPVPDA